MSASVLHPTPRWSDIFRAQLRAIWIASRRELAAIGGLLTVVMLAHLASGLASEGERFELDLTEIVLPIVTLAFFAPMAVWKDQDPSRRAYFWAMPVNRARHTLVKVLGGWVWLMAPVAFFLLSALALALLTGGNVGLGFDRTEIFLRGVPEATRIVDLMLFGHPWMWLVPFTGATAAYLLASIVVLSTRHPWRWLAGIVLAFWFILRVAEPEWLLGGRYGLKAVFQGLSDQIIVLPGGVDTHVERWASLPDAHAWVVATFTWTALALAGVWMAALRHRER